MTDEFHALRQKPFFTTKISFAHHSFWLNWNETNNKKRKYGDLCVLNDKWIFRRLWLEYDENAIFQICMHGDGIRLSINVHVDVTEQPKPIEFALALNSAPLFLFNAMRNSPMCRIFRWVGLSKFRFVVVVFAICGGALMFTTKYQT